MKKTIAAAILVISTMLFFLAYNTVTIFVIQPIGAVPEGKTLIVERAADMPFIDSADAMCLRRIGEVSLFCRGLALVEVTKLNIYARLPYSEWLYLRSTSGRVYDERFAASAPEAVNPQVPAVPQPLGDSAIAATIKPVMNNLATPNRFLKVGLRVVFVDGAAKQTYLAREIQVMDALMTLISSLTYDDVTQKDGLPRLKAGFLSAVNKGMGISGATEVFLTEFAVQ